MLLDIYLFDIIHVLMHMTQLSVTGQVDSLQAKLLEKLEQSLGDLQLNIDEIENVSMKANDPSKQGKVFDTVPTVSHEVSEHEAAFFFFCDFLYIAYWIGLGLIKGLEKGEKKTVFAKQWLEL